MPDDVFPTDACYVALGHLHKAQHVGREIVRYSGSLIPLSATEQPYQHGVTLVSIDGSNVTSEHIPIDRPLAFLRLPESGGEIRLTDLHDQFAALPYPSDLPLHLRPFVQIRLSREGLVTGFREQVERIATDFPVRIVEARPDPLPAVIAQIVAGAADPYRSLAQREPEDMFRLAFERVIGVPPDLAHLEVFHRAYSEAQS